MVQLSYPYMTTRKTIALAIWIFVSKVMSLLFNMLPRLVIAFLPRNKHLLYSWLRSPSAVSFSSVHFSRLVVSDSLWPHELKHTRLPCPSPSPGVCLNLCPLNQWCYLTITSSAALFSFCLQSSPASGSFPVSWLFGSGGQSIRTSGSVLPVNT